MFWSMDLPHSLREGWGKGRKYSDIPPQFIHSNLWWYIEVKAIPLQAWTGPEGSRRLRLPVF